MTLTEKVKKLLFNTNISGYRIHKDTHVAQPTLVKYRNKQLNIENMTLKTAERLGIYYDKVTQAKK